MNFGFDVGEVQSICRLYRDVFSSSLRAVFHQMEMIASGKYELVS